MADLANMTGPGGQTDPSNQPKEPPEKPHFLLRTTFICASLLLTQLSLSLALFFVSYRKYNTWYKTTHHLQRTNDLIIHTTLFIATCAPLCSIIGVGVGAAYYWRKRCKYGKYEMKMRKKGRGYWVDPSDREDKRMEGEALKVNAEIRRENERAKKVMKEEQGRVGLKQEHQQQQQQRARHISFAPLAQTKKETKRISFFSNPYGWVMKRDGERAGESAEQSSGRVGLGRSESVKTCASDETTRKGVEDIWSRKKGKYQGEHIEMVTRRS